MRPQRSPSSAVMTFSPSGLGWVTSDLPVQVLSRGVGVPAVLGRLLARLGSHRRSVLQTQDSVETNRGPHPRSTGRSHCSGVTHDHGSGCLRLVPALWLPRF